MSCLWSIKGKHLGSFTDINPFLAACSVGCQIHAVQLFPLSITARSIIALFAEKLFANPDNGFVQRLYLDENLHWDRGILMLSQVIPRGLNLRLVQEAEMRNHVRLFGKGSFIHPHGDTFLSLASVEQRLPKWLYSGIYGLQPVVSPCFNGEFGE